MRISRLGTEGSGPSVVAAPRNGAGAWHGELPFSADAGSMRVHGLQHFVIHAIPFTFGHLLTRRLERFGRPFPRHCEYLTTRLGRGVFARRRKTAKT